MPGREDMPSTLRRSPKSAQDTWVEAHDSALETYGEGGAAPRRVAFAALKHTHHKVGDHWEPKGHKGPSDERARSGGPDAKGESFGGIDVEGATKADLMERARKAGVAGRSRMSKRDLARALARRGG